MNNYEPLADPSSIERDIVHTRASLHRKLDELQHRLNPRERMRAEAERVTSTVRHEAERVKSAVRRVDPAPLVSMAALAAVAVGAAMAIKGLRRGSRHEAIVPDAEDSLGE